MKCIVSVPCAFVPSTPLLIQPNSTTAARCHTAWIFGLGCHSKSQYSIAIHVSGSMTELAHGILIGVATFANFVLSVDAGIEDDVSEAIYNLISRFWAVLPSLQSCYGAVLGTLVGFSGIRRIVPVLWSLWWLHPRNFGFWCIVAL